MTRAHQLSLPDSERPSAYGVIVDSCRRASIHHGGAIAASCPRGERHPPSIGMKAIEPLAIGSK